MVIAMMSIIAAIALPRMSSANLNYRLKASANRIIQDFDLAKKQAQAISQDVVITFDLTNHLYEISNLPALNDSTKIYRVELNHYPYNTKIEQVITTDTTTIVTINALGMLDQDATITIYDGSTKRIILFDVATNSATDISTW